MKQLLVVSYYFPPSGGPGVQRTLKFVRYLPDFGWQPTVVTVAPNHAAWPSRDEGLLEEVPASVRVIRTRSWDPYAAYARMTGREKDDSIGVGFADDRAPDWREKAARWVRANVFVPDARVGWVPHARRAVKGLLAGTPDAIMTTGPPHSTHFVGRMAAKRGVPWVADFRDPWSELSYYDQLPFLPWMRALDRRLERGVLRDATAVLTVSPTIGALLRAKTDRPVHVIPNGYDPADFDVDAERGAGTRLRYVGTLTDLQNPEALWSVVADLQRAGADLHLDLVGRVDAAVRSSLDRIGVGNVTVTPYVPHPEAVAWMKGADLLLLAVPRTRDASGILTGKLFEYLAAGPPVLGLGPVDSDAADVLRTSGAGRMLAYDDAAGIRSVVRSVIDGEATTGGPEAAIQRYARRALTRELASVLDGVAAS